MHAFLFSHSITCLQIPLLNHKLEYFGTNLVLNNGNCIQTDFISSVQKHRLVTLENSVLIKRSFQNSTFIQIIASTRNQVEFLISQNCNSVEYSFLSQARNDQVIPLIINGPPSNRIDVVFMGDGYTIHEKEKFISDIKTLVDQMWSADTFKSVLPLFNIWAVFTPSRESGIGINGKPKDTAFGLYRDGTELRGIYPSKPNDIRNACKATGKLACDFPSVIANDDFYGGLGGEFVISTSGTIVLRHEMGHNFVNVGEEYDGGQVYSGCNSAHSLKDISWKEWMTEPKNLVEQRGFTVVQDYAWFDLSKGPYIIKFRSKGIYKRWMLKISVSGLHQQGSLLITLDGVALDWKSSGNFDRAFSEWSSDTGLSKGWHELVFKEGFPATSGNPIHQLCSVDMHEYAAEPYFHANNSFIGAYPTFDLNGKKTYRPSNEGCLMRNMTQHQFCNVCKQGLWHQLLKRISLIDRLEQKCTGGIVSVNLIVLGLGQFRSEQYNEYWTVKWYKHGKLMPEYNNQFSPNLTAGAGESWRVNVKFTTVEVRKDDKGLLKDRLEFVTCDV